MPEHCSISFGQPRTLLCRRVHYRLGACNAVLEDIHVHVPASVHREQQGQHVGLY